MGHASVFPQEYGRHRVFLDSLPAILDVDAPQRAKPEANPFPQRERKQRKHASVGFCRGNGSDMFGGHGLFQDVQPIGLCMASFGLLPVSFRPGLTVSFHPLRSTLGYCLAWMGLVLWSGHRMVEARAALLAGGATLSMQTRFATIICFSHASGLVLVPLLWAEAHKMQRHQGLCASLMTRFGDVRSGCHWARSLSWLAVAFGVVLSPLLAYLWLRVVAEEGSHWTHVFIDNHVLLLMFELASLFASQFHAVKTFAVDLSKRLSKELSTPCPCARRVADMRRGWLELRDVTQGLVAMPLTVICMFVYTLIMFTLEMYLTLVCIIEGQLGLGVLISLMSLFNMLLLLLFCDAVHCAANAVSKHFLQPLETFSSIAADEAALEEINVFREVVSASTPIGVTAGGFWCIGRHTMSSMLAASAGYLIVLIQFRQSDYASAVDGPRNHSSNAADSAALLAQ